MPLALALVGLVFLVAGGIKRSAVASPEATSLSVDAERVDTALVAVLIGAGFCGACRSERFAEAFLAAREELERLDSSVVFVGAFLDDEVADGLALAEDLGYFHEIIAGGNWTNHAADRYMWRMMPGPATVPQLILMRRAVEHSARGIIIIDETVLRRLVGITEIEQWVEQARAHE